MFFGSVLIFVGWEVVALVRKSYSGPAEIASFSRQDFSQSKKHNTFWHVVSTGYFMFYFNESLLFPIFIPWKIIKTMVFPYLLSLLQSTVNIFICFKYYTLRNQFFLLQCRLRFFIFNFDLIMKHHFYFVR